VSAKPPKYRSAALCLVSFMVLSCGYIGDPLPPALNIPVKITDLRVSQQAGRVVTEFTIPSLTTEGLGLKLRTVELQAGPWNETAFQTEQWAASAPLVPVTCAEPGPCHVEAPAREWTGREVFMRVRAVSTRGRPAEWSDFAIIRVLEPLETPGGVRVQGVPQGVWVTWDKPTGPAGVAFRVRRLTAGEESTAVVVTVPDRSWLDATTEYGKQYAYRVQTMAKAGTAEATSEWSPAVEITPADRFPPAVPSGLAALAGEKSAELGWERNTEADLRGYRVYRASGGGPFEPVAGPLAAPNFSDRSVESGKAYRYAVSAIDMLNNESALSAPVEIVVP